MTKPDRRSFLKFLAVGSAMTSTGLSAAKGFAKSGAHVVVIGGGTGGATAAK